MTTSQTPAAVTSSPLPTPAGEPIWVDLTTPEPQRARDFYAALFGWDYTISEEFGGHANAHVGGLMAAGISPAPPQDMDSPTAWTVYFASDDIHADAARITELGGQSMFEPMQIGDQGHMGFFADPAGATFGLWQDDQHGGFAAYQGLGRLAWAEVNTRDSAPTVAFYSQLLRADAEQIPGADYHQLTRGGAGFAGVLEMNEQWDATMSAHWMIYFYTEDVDMTAKVAEENGGKVLVAPFDMDYGRMAVLSDPGGAAFSVMNPQRVGG